MAKLNLKEVFQEAIDRSFENQFNPLKTAKDLNEKYRENNK